MGIHERQYYRDDESLDLAPSWRNGSAVTTIIIACIAVFLANAIFTSRGDTLQRFLSLHTSDLSQPWVLWRTITYGFAHDPRQLTHIVFNLLGLYMLGRNVEERYGRNEFYRIYFASLVVCGGVWLIIQNSTGRVATLCGASGAISCVEMLFVLNFPNAVLLLFGVVPIKAWMLGIVLIVSNVLGSTSGVRVESGEAAIAWDVHLVGIGFAAAYFYSRWNFGRWFPSTWSFSRWRRRWFGPQLKSFSPDDKQLTDEEEADRLLDKIHRSGQDSLTSRERKFLTQYSARVRQRRESD